MVIKIMKNEKLSSVSFILFYMVKPFESFSVSDISVNSGGMSMITTENLPTESVTNSGKFSTRIKLYGKIFIEFNCRGS